MARQRQHQADDAAKAASEAAKVLQQRSQASREVVEKVPEAPPEAKPDDYVPPKRHSDQRSAMLEEMVASRPNAAPDEPEAPKEEPKAEAVPEVVDTPETVETAVEAPKTVKAKVDGEEFDVPQAEIDEAGGLRAWQRDKAAENRFKKSNDVLAEIRKTQAEMVEQAKAQAKPKEPDVTDQQYIAERMDKVRFGTPEEAAQAQIEIQHRLTKQIDPNSIIEQAATRIKHDTAVAKFDQEFQDIVTNPMLLRLVLSLRNERIAQQKGHVDWENFYRSIGNEVRSVVGKPTSQTTTQAATSGTTSQQSEREARKAAAAVVVPTASARAAPPQEEKPETRADILKGMRKTRGLPVD